MDGIMHKFLSDVGKYDASAVVANAAREAVAALEDANPELVPASPDDEAATSDAPPKLDEEPSSN